MSPQAEVHIGEVEQIAGRLEAAFNLRDPAALAALYTEGAILMPPNELQVQGRRAIRLWFDKALPGSVPFDCLRPLPTWRGR
jgi:ketosteroid isomerase-like protein